MALIPGTPDYYKDVVNKLQTQLNSLTDALAAATKRKNDWTQLCQQAGGCDAYGTAALASATSDVDSLTASITAKVSDLTDAKKLYNNSVTAYTIQVNKTPAEIAADAAAAAKQRNYRIALIAVIIIVIVAVIFWLRKKYKK